MSQLTNVEEECQMVLRVLLDNIAAGRATHRYEHRELTGMIRNALKRLDNKEFGCVQGLHSSYCTCRIDLVGRCARGH